MRVGELKYSSRPPSVAFFPGFLFWWFILKTATTGRKTKLSRRLWWDRFGLYLAARDCDARLTPRPSTRLRNSQRRSGWILVALSIPSERGRLETRNRGIGRSHTRDALRICATTSRYHHHYDPIFPTRVPS